MQLTESDLDKRIADKLLPGGCSQQGRYETREWVPMDFRPGWYIQSAEAASEISADDDWQPPFTTAGMALILASWVVLAALFAVLY